MTPAETLTLAAYFFVLIILAVYGWHRYYLVYLYMTNRDKEPRPGALPDPLPVITVQLPIYTEMYVADRLVQAVCSLDYPRDQLEGRQGACTVGAHQSGLFTAHEDPVDSPRRPLRARARRTLSQRALLQLQRHRRYLAPPRDRRGWRMAARHAHRGSRSELPRT